MTRMLFAFFIVFVLFYFGIETFRHMTGQEKLSLIKTTLYSLMCAVLTTIVLSIFVITF